MKCSALIAATRTSRTSRSSIPSTAMTPGAEGCRNLTHTRVGQLRVLGHHVDPLLAGVRRERVSTSSTVGRRTRLTITPNSSQFLRCSSSRAAAPPPRLAARRRLTTTSTGQPSWLARFAFSSKSSAGRCPRSRCPRTPRSRSRARAPCRRSSTRFSISSCAWRYAVTPPRRGAVHLGVLEVAAGSGAHQLDLRVRLAARGRSGGRSRCALRAPRASP